MAIYSNGGPPYNSPNLFFTDSHDIETMLLNSPALDKVVDEFGSEEKITSFGRDVRTLLLDAGIPVGYLLWVSQLKGLNLTFEEIKFSNFIDNRTLQIDELKLIQEVKNKSQAHRLKSEDLQRFLTEQKKESHDPWQVCCGHHLVEILSLGLRRAIGSAKPSDTEPNRLELSLRLAYESAYFSKTAIYSSVRLWENTNQPYKVWRDDL